MFVSGLANSAWLKMLKNSPLISNVTLSVIAVVFDTVRSTFTIPGPRRKFRENVPYVAKLGFATTCASEGKIFGPGVQGGGSLASPH
jgi:hypothetical protein